MKNSPKKVISKKRTRQGGFSMIELMIAVVVLAIGLVGGAAIISVAISGNGRSRYDTTAVALAESVMERIVAIPTSATGAAAKSQLTDCNGATTAIDTTVGNGANLIAAGTNTGNVDFTQAFANVPAGYAMKYVSCSNGSTNTYDIRWRVDAGPTAGTQLITVGVKNTGQIGNGDSRYQQNIFNLPVTLKTLRGDF